MRYVPRRNREGLNVVELCSGAERTNGGPPCAATVGAYEQMVVCTENSVLIDYVTESPNVTGDDHSVMLLPDPVGLAVQVEEPPGPAVDGDQVRLTLEAVTTEELAHVWALFPNTNYRTSVVYVASPVRIDK
jgi:hypothetical protein